MNGQIQDPDAGKGIAYPSKPTQTELDHARLMQYLHPGRTLRWPWGTVGYPNPARFPGFQLVIYRPDIYELPSHRNKPNPHLLGFDPVPDNEPPGGVWQLGDDARYTTHEEVLAADPASFHAATFGPELVDVLQALCDTIPPGRMPMARQYATLIVRAIFEFDWEPFLMAAALDARAFGKLIDRFGESTLAILKGWARIDRVPAAYLHDDIAATRGLIFSPAWMREYVYPWYRRFVDVFHDAGKKVLYVSDGLYLDALDDLLDTGMDGFAIETAAMDPGDVVKRAGPGKFYRFGVSSRTMDFGKPGDVRAELEYFHRLLQDYPAIWFERGGTVPDGHPNAQALQHYYKKIFGDGPETATDSD